MSGLRRSLISVVVGADLQFQLASIKSFGISAGRVALHPPQSHDREESLGFKPMLPVLRFKGLHEVFDLFLTDLFSEGYKDVRLSHVTVIFRNFVFENQMIAKRVPGQ